MAIAELKSAELADTEITSKDLVLLDGMTFPVIGYVKVPRSKDKGSVPEVIVPMVELSLMSDFRWQLNVLMDRVKDPDKYRDKLGEDVDATIERLTVWVTEHVAEAVNLKADEKAFLNTLIGKEAAK